MGECMLYCEALCVVDKAIYHLLVPADCIYLRLPKSALPGEQHCEVAAGHSRVLS